MEKFSVAAALVILSVATVSGIHFSGILEPNPETNTETTEDVEEWRSEVANKTPEKATLAGGCFWCTEAVYMGVEGVEAAVSGYAEGKASTATYDQVKTGSTDHREAVRLRYYPSVISYEEILDLYWRSIDPTDDGGQFTDRGYQYTTAIYAHNEEQYQLALETKRNLSQSDKFDKPIVTEVKNFTTFFKAEDYHQNYSQRRSARYNVYKQASGRKNYLEKFWDNTPF